MNKAIEKDIYRVLCTAGKQELAREFARSRGYRVQAGKLSNANAKFQPIPYEKIKKDYSYGPSALRLKPEGKGKLTKTEQDVLARITTVLRTSDVVALGWISRTLQYGAPVKQLKKAQLNALFSLLSKGALQFGLVTTTIPVLGKALGLDEKFGIMKPLGFHGSQFYALTLPGKSLPSEPKIDPHAVL